MQKFEIYDVIDIDVEKDKMNPQKETHHDEKTGYVCMWQMHGAYINETHLLHMKVVVKRKKKTFKKMKECSIRQLIKVHVLFCLSALCKLNKLVLSVLTWEKILGQQGEIALI